MPERRPGDVFMFGSYPQICWDIPSPINWLTLDVRDGIALLVSEKVLDCRPYHHSFAPTTWQGCDLRRWLNREFFATFTPSEQAAIVSTRCEMDGQRGPDTLDKVFLLSKAEVARYTPILGENRAAYPSIAAEKPRPGGGKLYVYNGLDEDGYIETETNPFISPVPLKYGCSWWWLRSQPRAANRAAFVGLGGGVRGYARVNRKTYGVRPAIRLRYTP